MRPTFILIDSKSQRSPYRVLSQTYSNCGIQVLINSFEESGEVKEEKDWKAMKNFEIWFPSFVFERLQEVQQELGSGLDMLTPLQSEEA